MSIVEVTNVSPSAIVESATPVDPAAGPAEPQWIVRSIVITTAAPVTKKNSPPEPKAAP